MYDQQKFNFNFKSSNTEEYNNIKSEMRSFKSNENIHKKEGGSYYVVSANKASSVTLYTTRQRKPEETYCNFANFK